MIGAVKLNASAAKTTEIVVTRTIAATPSAIFDLWIDSKSPDSPWFGAARAIVQPVVTTGALRPQGNQTLLKLRQTNVPDDEMGRCHEAGWGFVIGAIVEQFQYR
jgi:hypothetical protein